MPEVEYPLETVGVMTLPSARDKFYHFVQALRANPDQPFTTAGLHAAFAAQPAPFQEELLELAGVCAYDNPAAYWYGQEPAKPEHELVAFDGVKVAVLAPEQYGGGVIAAVIKESIAPVHKGSSTSSATAWSRPARTRSHKREMGWCGTTWLKSCCPDAVPEIAAVHAQRIGESRWKTEKQWKPCEAKTA